MTTGRALSLRWLPDADAWQRFELTSRGDRIEARLHRTRGGGLHPIAVVLATDAANVEPIEGVATLALDLPLLGGRASLKWTERLSRCLRDGPSSAADATLVEDFTSQAAHDVAAGLDACATLPGVAPRVPGVAPRVPGVASRVPGVASRVAFLGLGPGACVAPCLAECEPRITSFVLAPDGLARSLDPSATLASRGHRCARVANAAEGAARVREALAAAG